MRVSYVLRLQIIVELKKLRVTTYGLQNLVVARGVPLIIDVSPMSFFSGIHSEHKFHPNGNTYVTSDKFQMICLLRFDKNITN